MDFPPSEWLILPAEDFETATARDPGDLGLEVLVQMRPNGRIMDHWRIAVGGSKILEVKVKLSDILPAVAELPAVMMTYQKWPAEIEIRRNMTTSAWADITDLLTANEVHLATAEGDVVENATAIETLGALRDKAVNSASWRWAICVGESARMELQLQCLPGSAALLTSKPQLKRYGNNNNNQGQKQYPDSKYKLFEQP